MSPTFWQSLDAALSEVCRLVLEEPGQPRFKVIEVSEVVAAQVVLEKAEEVQVARRQVGGVWWV
jgi:Ethanolamine utilization protein EutJ (predicted chaperonin)